MTATAYVVAEDAAVELDRVVERLRTMSLVRLSAEWPPHASRAVAARELAQRLADLGADTGGWPSREVPDAGHAAVGDQVAVTGRDLLALDPPESVRADMAAMLREVRLSL